MAHRGQRPAPVRAAVVLVWVGVALFALETAVAVAWYGVAADARSTALVGAALVVRLLVVATVLLLLATFVDRGRPWARVVLSVVMVAAAIAGALGFGSGRIVDVAASLAGIALAVAVVVLLWRPASAPWFRR